MVDPKRRSRRACGTVLAAIALATPVVGGAQGTIPTLWDEAEIHAAHVPLADRRVRVQFMPSERYYALTVRVLHKTYPVYHPDHEPPGYMAKLEQLEPEVLRFDAANFTSEQQWIDYGREVFQFPVGSDAEAFSTLVLREQLRDSQWYDSVPVRWDRKTGVMPYVRYLIREKGKVEVGALSCAMCHTRILDDGTVIVGAQGNFPFDRSIAFLMRSALPTLPPEEDALKLFREFDTLLFGAPWRRSDPLETLAPITLEKYIELFDAIPPGVLARTGASPLFPVQIPDLIGLRERKYLDRTGLIRHRGIVDLMRYAALNVAADVMTRYDDFVPMGEDLNAAPRALKERYSDEQLFALAKYIYSLVPPANPNLPRTDDQRAHIARGKAVFERLHCGLCHRPPLYTNNRLTPVEGFEVPAEHREAYDITEVSLGTDPNLALETRRGTGYYKVPSLLGVWYRGPFEHNGSVATLEDWFDPRRLRDDYVPTGWKGPPGTQHRAVKGHTYGLNLPPDERTALIAFLRTL